MKREEVIKEFAVFIADRTMEITEREFYEEILLKMSCAPSREAALDVFLSNIFASVFTTLEQFQKISQQELYDWGDKQLPRFRKFFRSPHSPKKILGEKEAVKKVIYFILKEFIKDEVVEELNGWARRGELAVKFGKRKMEERGEMNMEKMKKVLEKIIKTKDCLDEMLKDWGEPSEKEKGADAQEFIDNLVAWIVNNMSEVFADDIKEFGGLIYLHFIPALLKAARLMAQKLGEDLYPPFGGTEDLPRN